MSVGTLSRRGVGLVVALLLAAFATAAWVSYVRSIEKKAVQGNASVQVYVASATIPAGTTGDVAVAKGLVAKQAVPRRLVADGAVTNAVQLRGRVTGSTIAKGEQVLLSRFVSPAEAGRLLSIPQGMQAMSVQVDAPPGVAGFIQARDRVSVIAKVDRQNADAEVRFLMQNVEVLAVGHQTAVAAQSSGAREAKRNESQAQPSDSSKLLLTLAVSPAQAEQLAFAVLEGQVYFTLLPPGGGPAVTPGRTTDSLFR